MSTPGISNPFQNIPYPHNEEKGTGVVCSVKYAKFCGGCGPIGSIAWIFRHLNQVPEPYETAKRIYDKWDEEQWYGREEERPQLLSMLEALKALSKMG